MQRMIRNPGAHLFGMDCACGPSRPFMVKAASVVCEECGRSHDCAPPVIGVDERSCECGDKRTFILDIPPSEDEIAHTAVVFERAIYGS